MTNGSTVYNPKLFISFIGWARTGHSLVGSLLDAHPNVVISNEFHVYHRFKEFKRQQLFRNIINDSKQKFDLGRPASEEYYQYINNSYQGTYTRLDAIGDKKGGGTLVKFINNPYIVEDFKKYIKIPVKFILVLRNPIDSITTSLVKRPNEIGSRYNRYKENFKQIENFLDSYRDITHIMRFEDLILDFKNTFTSLLEFLNLEYSEDYIQQCNSIVFNSVPKSRNKLEWSEDSLKLVRKLCEFKLLESYKGSF